MGVDGCRGGWLAATRAGDAKVHATFADLLRAEDASVLVVDIPIGLLDEGASGDRACDKAARTLLGPRRASVFPPPLRPRLLASTRPPGMSVQTYHILPKIREVDARLAREPSLQSRVVEGHPELAFRTLAGEPMRNPKRLRAGRDERRACLAQEGIAVPDAPPSGAAWDDLLDALALAWTAERVARGTSLRVGAATRDSAGLRMEIHA